MKIFATGLVKQIHGASKLVRRTLSAAFAGVSARVLSLGMLENAFIFSPPSPLSQEIFFTMT